MISLNHVSFAYKTAPDHRILKDISLSVPRGQVLLLVGESGCGKSTLLRVLNGLIPNYYEGELQGDALLELPSGPKSILEIPLYDMAKYSGTVFQNPKSQFFNVNTTNELAFTLENLGVEPETIRCRISAAADKLHLQPLLERSLFSLSGGEKQKIACAAVEVAGTELILLDEPVANLDETSIADMAKIIAKWKQEGKTILIAEHRVAWVLPLVDRVILMRDGELYKEYTREEFSRLSDSKRRNLGIRSLRPVTVNEAATGRKRETELGSSLEICNLQFSYKRHQPVLNLEKLELPLHEIVAVTGINGAGKTTLFRCLAGMQRGWKGKVMRDGQKISRRALSKSCFMVMQDVGAQLFTESALEEVLISMQNRDEKKARDILSQMDLSEYEDAHPMTLSGGQKQRLAIACGIAADCDILLLDEPTAGLDYRHMMQTAEMLRTLRSQGKSIFVITHDAEFIQEVCRYAVTIQKEETPHGKR